MNAEGRIVTAARWISGANGTLGGAAGTTGLGYGKSKWQRATEANRAVEYAIKGVVMALDGRVNQRHNSRELAHHLQRRGEHVGMAQLDDVEPQKGRTPTPYEEFEARPPTSGKNSKNARRATSLSATRQESRPRNRTGPKARRRHRKPGRKRKHRNPGRTARYRVDPHQRPQGIDSTRWRTRRRSSSGSVTTEPLAKIGNRPGFLCRKPQARDGQWAGRSV